MKTKTKTKAKIILMWSLVVIWMGVIFFLSSQIGEESSKLSSGITEVIVTFIETVVPKYQFDINDLRHIVRKNAHFFVYLGLGVLVFNALFHSGVRKLKCSAFSLLICFAYAASDEIHQIFVPGRGSQALDVLIDTAGASVGILFCLLIVYLISLKSKKHIS